MLFFGKVPDSSSIPALILTKGAESTARKPEQWIKVGSKKWEKEKKKIRPEIIITSKKGDMSYADILQKIEAYPELTDLGGSVSHIGLTQKGDVMLELNKSSEKTADSFRG